MWYVAAPSTHLTTKCEIGNDVDYQGGLVEKLSELSVGSDNEYEELKEKQVLFFFFFFFFWVLGLARHIQLQTIDRVYMYNKISM